MAKQSGLGDNLYAGGYNLSGDTNSLSKISGSIATIDVTDITQSANSRLGGLRDGEIDWVSYFDPAAGMSHAVLSALPVTDVLLTYCRGTTLSNPAACLVAKQLNYDGTRANTGEFTFALTAQANGYGLQWGKQLTAGLRTDSSATAGAYVDDGAASSFGGQAFLHVTAFTGTSVTVAVQHATTSGGSYANVTGLAFTAVTAAPAWQQLATSNTTTIDEFVKVTTTGTFTHAVFSVVFVRNTIAGQVF